MTSGKVWLTALLLLALVSIYAVAQDFPERPAPPDPREPRPAGLPTVPRVVCLKAGDLGLAGADPSAVALYQWVDGRWEPVAWGVSAVEAPAVLPVNLTTTIPVIPSPLPANATVCISAKGPISGLPRAAPGRAYAVDVLHGGKPTTLYIAVVDSPAALRLPPAPLAGVTAAARPRPAALPVDTRELGPPHDKPTEAPDAEPNWSIAATAKTVYGYFRLWQLDGNATLYTPSVSRTFYVWNGTRDVQLYLLDRETDIGTYTVTVALYNNATGSLVASTSQQVTVTDTKYVAIPAGRIYLSQPTPYVGRVEVRVDGVHGRRVSLLVLIATDAAGHDQNYFNLYMARSITVGLLAGGGPLKDPPFLVFPPGPIPPGLLGTASGTSSTPYAWLSVRLTHRYCTHWMNPDPPQTSTIWLSMGTIGLLSMTAGRQADSAPPGYKCFRYVFSTSQIPSIYPIPLLLASFQEVRIGPFYADKAYSSTVTIEHVYLTGERRPDPAPWHSTLWREHLTRYLYAQYDYYYGYADPLQGRAARITVSGDTRQVEMATQWIAVELLPMTFNGITYHLPYRVGFEFYVPEGVNSMLTGVYVPQGQSRLDAVSALAFLANVLLEVASEIASEAVRGFGWAALAFGLAIDQLKQASGSYVVDSGFSGGNARVVLQIGWAVDKQPHLLQVAIRSTRTPSYVQVASVGVYPLTGANVELYPGNAWLATFLVDRYSGPLVRTFYCGYQEVRPREFTWCDRGAFQ